MFKTLLTICASVGLLNLHAQDLPTSKDVLRNGPSANALVIEKGNGKISGTITDGSNNTPVEFANIVLTAKGADKPTDGTIADDKGKFLLKGIAEGEYRLDISFIGFKAFKIEGLVIEGNNELNVGTIKLEAEVQALEEVTVEGERSLVENKIDRLVYNAEKDLTNAGGTAADVMQKVPQLSMDQDGNVQLRGSSNVRVLINNKPSAIMAGSVADALKQIPADMIKSVEVITSPSAKYDAEGSAGIINIVTKKNNLQGVNGTINAGAGTRSSNLGLNVGAKKGKLGVSLAAFSNIWYQPGDGVNQQIKSTEELNTILNENTDNFNLGTFGNGSLGLDYDINEKNTLSGGMKWSMFGMSNDTEVHSNLSNLDTGTDSLYSRKGTNSMANINMDFNLDFVHTFAQGHEFSVLTLYTRQNQNRDFDFDQFDANGDPMLSQRNFNDGINGELTTQLDYTRPIGKGTLEVGTKAILRDVSSDFRLEQQQEDGSYLPIPESTDIFNYDQNVVAGYLNYRINIDKNWGLQAGGRYEKTFVEGDFVTSLINFKTDYQNFIPSVTVSRNIKQGTSIKASYNQRIQRPNIFFLNPNINQLNPLNIQYGNPELDAELTHSGEIGYNTFIKSTSINATVYARFTDNAIQSYSFSDGNVLNTTYGNIGRNYSYGGSIFGSTKITPKWNISGNVNVYYIILESTSALVKADNAGVMYNMNLNTSYEIGKGWRAQGFGMINSPRLTLQGKMSSFSYYNIGFRKDLWKKKGNIGLSMDNPFRQKLIWITEVENKETGLVQNSEFGQYNRGFKINFSYTFGKMGAAQQRPPKRKKSINNDDQKQGDNGGGMGGN